MNPSSGRAAELGALTAQVGFVTSYTGAVGWHALTALGKGVGARRTASIGADQLRDTQSNNAWGGAMQGLVSAEGKGDKGVRNLY